MRLRKSRTSIKTSVGLFVPQSVPDACGQLRKQGPGGLGLFLVFQVMDEVVHREVDGCNVVALRKKFAAEE